MLSPRALECLRLSSRELCEDSPISWWTIYQTQIKHVLNMHKIHAYFTPSLTRPSWRDDWDDIGIHSELAGNGLQAINNRIVIYRIKVEIEHEYTQYCNRVILAIIVFVELHIVNMKYGRNWSNLPEKFAYIIIIARTRAKEFREIYEAYHHQWWLQFCL